MRERLLISGNCSRTADPVLYRRNSIVRVTGPIFCVRISRIMASFSVIFKNIIPFAKRLGMQQEIAPQLKSEIS